MALTPCRECGREVSTEAGTCPGCGVWNPSGTEQGAKAEKESRPASLSDIAVGSCLGVLGAGLVLMFVSFLVSLFFGGIFASILGAGA